jgi:hypothetical protein
MDKHHVVEQIIICKYNDKDIVATPRSALDIILWKPETILIETSPPKQRKMRKIKQGVKGINILWYIRWLILCSGCKAWGTWSRGWDGEVGSEASG